MEVGQRYLYLIASRNERSLNMYNFYKASHEFYKMALLT